MKKTKRCVVLILLLLVFKTGLAQNRFHHLIGGSDHERAQTVFNTFDNGYIVNGASFSFGIGDVDALLIKTDSLGQILWSKAYGTTVYDNSEFAIEASDHGIVCSGRSNVQTGFPSSAIIFKTDSSGNLLWTKSFGGLGNDNLVHIIETSDHGFAATGRSQSLTSGANDILLVRTDANGDTIFTRSYGTSKEEEGLNVIQLPDNGFLIAGRQITFPSGISTSDGLLIRTDSSGNLLWSKLYGDSMWDEFSALRMTPDSGYIVTGSTISFGSGEFDILLMKTDRAGDVQWSKVFGGRKTDASYDIHIDSDQSFVLSGYTESLGHSHIMGNDSSNIFLLKTDSTGDITWMETYGDGLQDEGFRSAQADDGGYLIPGFTTNYLFNDSTQMIFIKTDNLGYSGCHEQRVQPVDSFVVMPYLDVFLNQLSGIVLSAVTLTQTSFVPDHDDACLFASLENDELKSALDIYPNPFENFIRISLPENYSIGGELTISDLLGKVIISEKIISTECIIRTDILESGVYVVSLVNSVESVKGKLILKY